MSQESSAAYTGTPPRAPVTDHHLHLTIDGRAATLDELDRVADQLCILGIGTVYDMGHRNGLGPSVRERWRGRICVRTAVFGLYRTGFYGGFIGRGVEGPRAVADAIDEAADRGADFIKLVNSGIVRTDASSPVTAGGFSREELDVAVDASRHHGLAVHCHANGDDAIRSAVLAGVASVEHGFFISLETIGIMAERRVSWTPTAAALLSIKQFAGPDAARRVDAIVRDHLDAVGHARTIGVEIRAGSDGGSKGIPHGCSLSEEIRLLGG